MDPLDEHSADSPPEVDAFQDSLTDPPACESGLRWCNGACVGTDDPATGCGAADCAACALPNAVAKCQARACVVDSCTEGWTDCNLEVADGCEKDLSTASTDCGHCGRDCGGATCANGLCSPTELLTDSSEVVVFLLTPNDLIYSTSSKILRTSKSGGPSPVVLEQPTATVSSMAADATYLYWVDGVGRKIMKGPYDVGGSIPIANTGAHPKSVVTNGSYVCWIEDDPTDGEVVSCVESAGGTPRTVTDNWSSFEALSISGDALFILGYYSYVWSSTPTSTPTNEKVLGTFGESYCRAITASATSVFIGCGGRIAAVGIADGAKTSVWMLDVDHSAKSIAVDGGYVYALTEFYDTTHGWVHQIPNIVPTPDPTLVANIAGKPGMIATDADYVYWSTDYQILRVRK
jgi:hypothetical protein